MKFRTARNWCFCIIKVVSSGFVLTIGTNQDDFKIKVGEVIVEKRPEEKLLRVTIDKKLIFKSHVSNLCKRASKKLHALARLSSFMGSDKLRLLMNLASPTLILTSSWFVPMANGRR